MKREIKRQGILTARPSTIVRAFRILRESKLLQQESYIDWDHRLVGACRGKDEMISDSLIADGILRLDERKQLETTLAVEHVLNTAEAVHKFRKAEAAVKPSTGMFPLEQDEETKEYLPSAVWRIAMANKWEAAIQSRVSRLAGKLPQRTSWDVQIIPSCKPVYCRSQVASGSRNGNYTLYVHWNWSRKLKAYGLDAIESGVLILDVEGDGEGNKLRVSYAKVKDRKLVQFIGWIVKQLDGTWQLEGKP